MYSYDVFLQNISSPVVLAFFLGIVSVLLKSDLKLPPDLYTSISIYLLLALGLKGGVQLSDVSWSAIAPTMGVTLLLGCVTPLIAYVAAKKLGNLNRYDSAALAAHYGSSSIVTFLSALTFLNSLSFTVEPFLTAMVVVLEVPAIIIALWIAHGGKQSAAKKSLVFREIITGKTIILLVGGLLIGLVSGKKNFEKIDEFFVTPFQGIVTLFLLEMGIIAGQKLKELRKTGIFILFYGVLIPIVHGCLGVILGTLAGLSIGGVSIVGTLAAGASYIAAPAAVRVGVPQANPTIYLTAALGVTFPFNVLIGIPFYLKCAQLMAKWWQP